MASSGELCIASGVYEAECPCRAVATIDRGERAPLCPQCGAAVGWRFVRSVGGRAAPASPPAPGSPTPAPSSPSSVA